MGKSHETKEEKLARREGELKDLKARLPEHCSGTKGYVSVHGAQPSLWQKIEDVEDEIKQIRADLGRGGAK
ncbi:MAG: hypothetical protein FJ272_18970 [Planctomycetes bacterium]|nr:hypothetical protein [Planctomycetota bacterium]